MTTDERLPSAEVMLYMEEEFFTKRGASSERERILKIIKHRRKFMTITIQDEYDELRAEIEKEGMK